MAIVDDVMKRYLELHPEMKGELDNVPKYIDNKGKNEYDLFAKWPRTAEPETPFKKMATVKI